MKLLVLSSLYPNAVQPNHGIFVENRLRHLLSSGSVEARVIAPVPWFPSGSALFGRYGSFARVPHKEERFGIDILHPRYPILPKIGMSLSPSLFFEGMKRTALRLQRSGYDFDLIDAHYFYPDGVAAALLAKMMRKPVVITARGSDINQIANFRVPRRMIVDAASSAAAVVAVSTALAHRMADIGIDPAKIEVLRNGVDLHAFALIPQAEARAALALEGPVLVAVGNLLISKGQDLAIRALPELPGYTLLLVGSGPHEGAFRRLAERQGVAARVRFVGRVPHHDLGRYYAAADVSLLPSMREGWPNVLLESMACGTPAVATRVGGVPEIIAAPEAGRIMPARTPEALAAAVRALLADPPARAATRAYAEQFSWDATIRGQAALFHRVLDAHRRNVRA